MKLGKGYNQLAIEPLIKDTFGISHSVLCRRLSSFGR